jgi:hypothetical protein
MEKSEHRAVIKFLWMKELGARRIHTELSLLVGDDCYSPAAIERWLSSSGESDSHVPIILDHVAQ